MGPEKLSSLAVLLINSEEMLKINLNKIIDIFHFWNLFRQSILKMCNLKTYQN